MTKFFKFQVKMAQNNSIIQSKKTKIYAMFSKLNGH